MNGTRDSKRQGVGDWIDCGLQYMCWHQAGGRVRCIIVFEDGIGHSAIPK